MAGLTEYLRRAAAPRLVVATGRRRWRQRAGAGLRRLLGRPLRIELFFAFDDPYAAIAVPGLIDIARRHRVTLQLRPLLARGIVDDPILEQRRLHAVSDSGRLLQRDGRQLSRSTPLLPQDSAFLAEWAVANEAQPGVNDFIAATLQRLWLDNDRTPKAADYLDLYRAHFGDAPRPRDDNGSRLARNAARLLKLGHWESPAAHLAGEWFFAHERLPQIDARLCSLGV